MGSCLSCGNLIVQRHKEEEEEEKPIPFVIPIQKGYVIKVYDGDTITIQFKLPYPKSPLYKISVRLNGLDCPEMRTNNTVEKECAQIAKQKVSDIVLHQTVELRNVGMEKYGRLLADVYFKDKSVNQWLIDNHLAVGYDGGTKISPDNWMDYHKEVVYHEFDSTRI